MDDVVQVFISTLLSKGGPSHFLFKKDFKDIYGYFMYTNLE